MKNILLVAQREFIATVSTKAFIIGLLIMPVMIGIMSIIFPRLLNPRNFTTRGDVVVIDGSGRAMEDIRAALQPERMAARREEAARQLLNQAPAAVQQVAGRGSAQIATAARGAAPDLRLVEGPAAANLAAAKAWLLEPDRMPHLAVVVIQPNAVIPDAGTYGGYDSYVPANADDRALNDVHQALEEGLVNARTRARGIDRADVEAIVRVPRGQSTTVTKSAERATVRGINQALPIIFVALMFMGVMTGGQGLMTSTVEEKSSRVMEVLLSALSPLELLAGKMLGQFGVSMIMLGVYIVLGAVVLLSFAMLGLINPWLLPYLVIFFVLSFLTYGALMVSIGAVVNDMREAQSLMMPLMLVLTFPFWVWFPISQNPNSAFSVVLSLVPPISSFAMLLRITSTAPPPWWQVWLSIGVGIGGVAGALWFAAKVFKIGLLMYGKPPNLATLVRWARQA
jgi:ABC-type Na+ efflux pump permease subunit